MNKSKKILIEMFYWSIDNDLDKWENTGTTNFFSPRYNDYSFNIDISFIPRLYITKVGLDHFTCIKKFTLPFSKTNRKIKQYTKKLKYQFKKTPTSELDIFASELITSFPQLVRKEKLNNINNSN